MARVFLQAEMVAPTDYSVMINGESGTGKEVLAGIIHNLSRRSKSPFMAVNMAAFNKSLFEDDFFGHKKGAFTDALTDKEGFFEKANGGTIFLDEISELELPLQGKLLRVIEERELYRLGSTTTRHVDVRIIAATNRNIDEDLQKGLFRKDLFYRLNTFSIKIPPLCERKKDILHLARFFMQKHAKLNNKNIDGLSDEIENYLTHYSFPGNVRELENIIASAVLLETTSRLTLSSAGIFIERHDLKAQIKEQKTKLVTLEELEKDHIVRVLQATKGNRSKTAEILGVNITTVYRKIEKYHIEDNCN